MQDYTPKSEGGVGGPSATSEATSAVEPLVDSGPTLGGSLRPPAKSVPPKPRGILLVEDDPDLQWKLARTLTVDGNRVVGTSSSDGALALMAEWPVEVVLVAEDLPGMDGIELAKLIRRQHPAVPVVLMAEEGPDVEVAARVAGAITWITKPFALDDLRSLLRGLGADRKPSETDPRPSATFE